MLVLIALRALLVLCGIRPLPRDFAVQYALKKADNCKNHGGSDDGPIKRWQPRANAALVLACLAIPIFDGQPGAGAGLASAQRHRGGTARRRQRVRHHGARGFRSIEPADQSDLRR